ncbi:MAG: ABC transporter ATP-binding protein/permease [Clostridia bacterium]|nr:ABC transporter ATP-binding protein/permease [Clostridia bacterium]
MLELKAIKKDYPAGGGVVNALKGIDLRFRKSEFVSILGPSGCGKTTMLNIIGGLDRYTSGDLIINARSTKEYKARDWDAYRNYSIGFVFQTYNLIPHQTVLQNVELALTLSGVSKSERRRRAKEALEKVGLADQLRKKPSEMSGGQMQRVAIARAIVNNPDIILADEPTGALDTETSVQVMEILKEISADRLVIMVTHNPDLAEQYSTRIIRMLDGKLIDDSAPITEEEHELKVASEKPAAKSKLRKKPSMSLFTAFGLSLKNLFTKKGRTMLTSFAGSIGIIGIALIYAVSQGTTNFVASVQEETLASYPLTLRAEHVDMTELLQTFINSSKKESDHKKDGVYSSTAVIDMFNELNNLQTDTNDLSSFKTYLEEKREEEGSKFNQSVTGVQYNYGLDLMVYTKSADGKVHRADSAELVNEIMKGFGMSVSTGGSAGGSMGSGMPLFSMGNAAHSGSDIWQELLAGDNGEVVNPLLKKQYDIINKGGHWPTSANEIVLVVDENNELDDMTLYSLGLKTQDEILTIIQTSAKGEQVETASKKWSYDEICAMEFRAVPNGECFKLTTDANGQKKATPYGTTNEECADLYEKGIPLKVTAIIRQSENATNGMLNGKGAICYTSLLTKEVIGRADNSELVALQSENKLQDIFTGLPFKADEDASVKEKAEEFMNRIDAMDEAKKIDIYNKISELLQLREMMKQGMVSGGMDAKQADVAVMQMSAAKMKTTISSMMGDQFNTIMSEREQRFKATPNAALLAEMQAVLGQMDEYQLASLYDQDILTFSNSTLTDNLVKLGKVDLGVPTSINLYAATFENKEVMEEGIAEYNEKNDEAHQISYTDYVGLIMSSVTTVIKAITYVLIAFVAVSLIVSSIMIGVITLISVQERTKEIGILRAIGASKRNVSSMFNAETVIIGFASGFVGVAITYLLCIPINLILHHLTNLKNLSATLPIPVAVTLILISMFLTLIAGIIPSRSAAKKDPVVALRTE